MTRGLRSLLVLVVLLVISISPFVPSVGAASAADSREVRVPTITFHEVRSFPEASLLYGESWAPRESLLAFQLGGNLAIFDASRPNEEPRSPEPALNTFAVAWSPSGTVLSLVVHEWLGKSHRNRIVLATPEGRGIREVPARERTWPVWWTADGALHGRDEVEPQYPVLLPPDASRGDTTGARHQPELVSIMGDVFSQSPGGEPTRALPESFRNPNAFLREARPELDRYLVFGVGVAEWDELLLDGRGQIRFDLRTLGIEYEPTSLSWDGKLVIGNTEEGDGHVIFGAKLFVSSIEEGWTAPVRGAGEGLGAHFAPFGTWLTYGDPVNGGVHVGWLEIVR